jgi:alkyl sulfatase BDS1-like metallo-beta-lactamase superfamily hydrolase
VAYGIRASDWGQQRLSQLIADQRDMYTWLNDQALRLINQGYTPMDITERLKRPPARPFDVWPSSLPWKAARHDSR